MAYNKKNYYEKIIKIQNIYLEHKNKGISIVEIYRRYIQNDFNISYSTFNNYLNIPAKMKLKKLNLIK